MREEEKLSREIRSVAPTISNAIIQTTRATSSAAAHVKSGSSSGSETSATASQAASDMTNGDLAGSVKPTEHEIVYYKTCLACREQQDLCKVLKNLIFFGCYFSPLSFIQFLKRDEQLPEQLISKVLSKLAQILRAIVLPLSGRKQKSMLQMMDSAR